MTIMIDLTLHSLVSKSFTVRPNEMIKHSVSKVSKDKGSFDKEYNILKLSSRLVSFD